MIEVKAIHDYTILMANDWRGAKNPRWNNGVRRLMSGYIMVKASPIKHSIGKDGYILEHRLIMEEYLNRKLLKTEIVHHKNHNRADNRLSNLELISSQSQHIKKNHNHISNYRPPKIFSACEICGRTNVKNATKKLCHNCYMKIWNRKMGIVKSN